MASILFVNKTSFRYPGGAETRIRAVATHLVGLGHRVYLLCAKTSPDEPRRSVEEGVVVRRVPVLPRALLRRFPVPHYLPQALFYVVGPPFILYYTYRWRIDAIRDSMSPFPGLSLLAPLLGKKAIVVTHILFGGYRRWRAYYPALYAVAGALAERSLLRGWLRYRRVVTDSPWLAQHIVRTAGSRVRVEAIENGVEAHAFRLRQSSGKVRRLLNAARLVAHKGHNQLIDACAQLRARGVDLELDIFGGGKLGPRLRAAVTDQKLHDAIRIRSALPRPEFLDRLAEYDLYVMTSLSEGLPMVLLEAMAARVPVVVAARPYATTLLDPAVARFYDPDDPNALAQAIGWAIAHPAEAEAQAERAHAWVARFTWARVAERESALIQTILDED